MSKPLILITITIIITFHINRPGPLLLSFDLWCVFFLVEYCLMSYETNHLMQSPRDALPNYIYPHPIYLTTLFKTSAFWSQALNKPLRNKNSLHGSSIGMFYLHFHSRFCSFLRVTSSRSVRGPNTNWLVRRLSEANPGIVFS